MEEIEINSGINNEKIHRTFKVNKTKEDYLHLIANELREHGVDKEKCDDLGDLPEDLYLIFNPYKREEEKSTPLQTFMAILIYIPFLVLSFNIGCFLGRELSELIIRLDLQESLANLVSWIIFI